MGTVQGKKALIVISNGKSTRANGYLERLENELSQAGVDAVATASRTQYDDGTLGNTNYIANLIQNETGGDLFAIEVEENHYPTDDFGAVAEIARDEIENGERPTMRTPRENPDDYDVIFVGYPIWWHTAPMIIGTFLESYDLTGAEIYPFAQSESMDTEQFDNSMEFVREYASGANVHDGLFVSASDTEGMQAYLEANGFVQ